MSVDTWTTADPTPCLCLLLWLWSTTVSSYEDLRGLTCKNQTTYSAIPGERAFWFGSVELILECDPGFDLPLNHPPDSTLSCLPDGSTWQPDFLPDCNDKIVPNTAQMTMEGHITKVTCHNLGSVTSRNFSQRVDLARICRQNHMSCTVITVRVNCQGQGSNGSSPSSVFLQLRFNISNLVTWETYTSRASGVLAPFILHELEPQGQSSLVNVSIHPVCPPGTTGVLREGLEVVCRGCSLGHYLDVDGKTCLPCLPGYYSDAVFSTSCKQCPGMPAALDDAVWNTVQALVPNRAHAISSCPMLYKHKNGSFQVINQSSVETLKKQTDEGRPDKRPERDPNEGSFINIITFLAVSCVAVAGLIIT